MAKEKGINITKGLERLGQLVAILWAGFWFILFIQALIDGADTPLDFWIIVEVGLAVLIYFAIIFFFKGVAWVIAGFNK